MKRSEWKLSIAVSLALASASCDTRRAAPPAAERPPSFARGERVVVEVRAAEFFEGRVLSITKNSLRVEPQNRGAPLSIATADAYKLSSSASALRVGQLAICRIERIERVDARWTGCRIQQLEGAELRAVSLDGSQHQLPRAAVLAASPTTELNLKQAFARARARDEFREGAERAGSPKASPGTRLLPRARVVARRGSAWYGGIVHELEKDGAQIEFSADGQREHLKSEDIVPEPPYPKLPERGDFALARPHSISEPWQTVRVIGSTDRQYRVSSVDGSESVVGARDLLPLVRR
jgi:hypothetical protein